MDTGTLQIMVFGGIVVLFSAFVSYMSNRQQDREAREAKKRIRTNRAAHLRPSRPCLPKKARARHALPVPRLGRVA